MDAEMVRQICKRTSITLFDQNNFNGSPDRRINFNLFYYFKHHTTYGKHYTEHKMCLLLYNVCPKCFCFDTYANLDRSKEGMSSSKASATVRSNASVFMSSVCYSPLKHKCLYEKRVTARLNGNVFMSGVCYCPLKSASLCKASVTEPPF
jgi:hypothetical protein